MAGIKISALPVSGPVLGTDIYPAVQGGITVKQTVNQLTTFMNSNVVLDSIAQVTGLSSALAGFLPLSGGTMIGDIDMGLNAITNLTNPVNPQDAATKAYVDTIAGGFTVILAALAATTVNLNATYANGAAGVGATLTDASGTFAAFSVDGVSPALNSRILVKNQTSTFANGVYVLTTNGDGISIPYVLTRATDYDQAPSEIKPGTLIAVNTGTVNGTTSWLETATVTTIGTDPILFSQFTFQPGAFFLIANNLSEGNPTTMRANLGLTGAATMTLPVSPANGGTGVANSNTITLGGNLLTAAAHTLSGAFASTFTFTGITNVTFPTTGTLLTSSQPTINQPNIVGVTNGSNATAGSVGEFVSSVIPDASGVSFTSNVVRNITSISLTAGDWDVYGNVTFDPTSGDLISVAWCSLTSATLPDGSLYSFLNTPSPGHVVAMCTPFLRVSVAASTTVYLSARANFSAGTCTGFGGIYARRAR